VSKLKYFPRFQTYWILWSYLAKEAWWTFTGLCIILQSPSNHKTERMEEHERQKDFMLQIHGSKAKVIFSLCIIVNHTTNITARIVQSI
jgi:hypothetical protein